jgi:hypothetical protein
MTDQTAPTPIRKSDLPTTPPPEWEFFTWFPLPDGSGDLVPGQRDRGVHVRRLVTYGDWEPVRPDHWAGEVPTAAASAGQAPATDRAALRDRITTAISRWHRDPEQPLYEQGADAVLAVLPAPADWGAAPVCICGHPEERHFEDVCQTCGCGDYLEPRDAAEVITRWRQAALKVRDGERAAVLREAADLYATLTDQNEAYDREHSELDEEARIQHATVRDVVAGLRRMADEAQPAGDQHCERCDGTGLDPDRYTEWATDGVVRYRPEPCADCQPAAGARQDGVQR